MKFKIHFGDLSTYHKKVCYYLFTNNFTPEYGDIVHNHYFHKIRFRGTKYKGITSGPDEYRTETIPHKPNRKGKIYTYKKNKIFKLIATDDISYKLPNIESLELPPHEHKQVMKLYEGCKKRLVVTEGKWGEKYVHIAPTIGEQIRTHRLDIMTYSFAIGAIIILPVRPDFFVGFIAFLIIFLIIIGVIGGLKEYLIPIDMNNQNAGSIILNIFLVGFGILFVMSAFHSSDNGGLVGLAVIIGLFGVIFLISILSSEESTTKKKATIKDAERRDYLVNKLYDNYLLNIAGNPSDSSKTVYDDEGNRFVSPKKFKQNIDNSTLKELEEFNKFMFDSRRTSRPNRGNSRDGYHGKTYW